MDSNKKLHIYTVLLSVLLSVIITFSLFYFTAFKSKPKINLNEATNIELQRIDGIGPVKSELIITNRPYQNKYDIIEIEGVGWELFEKIESEVIVE